MYLQTLAITVLLSFIQVDQSTGNCHYFSEARLDWFSALTACQKKDLCLANMDTERSFLELAQALPSNLRKEYAIGLNTYEKMSFGYVSEFNKSLGYVPPGSNLNPRKACGLIKPFGKDAFSLASDYCGRPLQFICSSAVECNGRKTNSTFVPNAPKPVEPSCPMSDEVKKIIGITK